MFAIMTEKKRAITHARPCSGAPLRTTRGAPNDPLFSPLIQRKPACACGGACPRCQEECDLEEELPIQTKLTVNEPGDKYEKEADRVAEQVMCMSEHYKPVGGGFSPVIRSQIVANPTDMNIQQGQNAPKRQFTIAQNSGSGIRTQQNLEDSIVKESLRSPGRPLEPPTRTFMEFRFGHDFRRVRVHTDSRAAESAHTLGAHAFTVGSHIVFGAGKYSPETHSGKKLLAHELAHVLQQNVTSVQIGSSQPLLIQRYPNCTPAVTGVSHPNEIIDQAKKDAIPVVSSALKFAQNPSGIILEVLNGTFHCPSQGDISHIEGIYEQLRSWLPVVTNIECRTEQECETDNPGTDLYAFVIGCGSHGRAVNLCPRFFQLSSHERALVMIHEGAHRFGVPPAGACTSYIEIYYWNSPCFSSVRENSCDMPPSFWCFPPPDAHLNCPDSYAYFVDNMRKVMGHH